MVGVQICFCILFTLVVCFFVGKRIGERKFNKIREEMKAYELAFNQLIEQMEMVSSHNLKVLQTKTDELRELIPVVDKKLLYANDMMTELETMKKETGGKIGPLKTEPVMDLKLRRDVQEMVSDLQNRLKSLESRMEALDREGKEQSARVTAIVEAQAGKVQKSAPKRERIPDPAPQHMQTNVEVSTFSPRISPEKPAFLKPHALMETPSVPESRPLKPRPGTVLHEVLTLHEKGVTWPQIARQLKIDHGEVEVIMNLYGGKGSLRKVT